MTVTDALVQTIIDITRGQAPREESPRRPWAAQLSNALRPHAEERLVTRMLTKIAVASEVPANARFVTDVLRSTNDLDLARIFAETAEADAHRPWQQRRISALKTRKPSTRTFGPRTCHTVYLDHGRVTPCTSTTAVHTVTGNLPCRSNRGFERGCRASGSPRSACSRTPWS